MPARASIHISLAGIMLFSASDTLECLLQKKADFVVTLLALLAELYKEIGGYLQCLVYGSGVFTVLCKFFKTSYKTMEQCQRFILDIG